MAILKLSSKASQKVLGSSYRAGHVCSLAKESPPEALGSGRAREIDKASSLAHMVSMTTASRESMALLASQVHSICTDMGTQQNLAACQVQMVDVAPKWWRLAGLEEEEGVLIAASASSAQLLKEEEDIVTANTPPDPRVSNLSKKQLEVSSAAPTFLPMALPIAGLEHIGHNMAIEVHNRLEHWPAYLVKVQVVASFLTRRWRRERFISLCLAESPLSSRAHEIREFSATLYQARWHHALLFIEQMWRVFSLLQVFSAVKYTEQGSYAKDTEFNAHTLESVLRDAGFIAYTKFILAVDAVPRKISQWSKGCPCHEHLQSNPATLRHVLRSCYGPDASCPLLGKRAAELACGRLQELTAEMVQDCFLQNVEGEWGRLTEEEIRIVRTDAANSKAHFLLQLSLKTDNWQRLPWVLAGISHWNPELARAAAIKALEAMSKHDIKAAHAPLTQKWMAEPLRGELIQFAGGYDVTELSEAFQREASALFWMPVNETVIEAKHALATRAIAAGSHSGAPVVSLSNRYPLLHRELDRLWRRGGDASSAKAAQSTVGELLQALDVARNVEVRD